MIAVPKANKNVIALALGALGVVFGDIGTSPLYALRECFDPKHGLSPTPEHVYGILSLIFWSLIGIVSLKYILLVMRADNRGEGGGMALLALISKVRATKLKHTRNLCLILGLFGASLVYGDGVITPAISVLSAVEGLEVATPIFAPFIVPISLCILTAIFFVQRYGTGRIGAVFGPVILVWFAVLALLGIYGISDHPEVLRALSPAYALDFFVEQKWHAFLALGAVFLVLTGAEALYADMGHFGLPPIRLAWFFVVFPALVLNYFGQGALILSDPSAARNPFYLLCPPEFLYPLVALSTLATIIASQALISGAFSVTHQAVQLSYLPRLEIRHTSSEEIGQIYVPLVNWLLYGAVVWLVISFGSSSALANAYGIAVSTTMIITTILTLFIARTIWGWSPFIVVPLSIVLIGSDLVFFISNVSKTLHGGWFPLAFGAFIFVLMRTWEEGREVLAERLRSILVSPERFIKQVVHAIPQRLPGTAIFMARSANTIPTALFHNVKHNQVLHERVLLVSVQTEEIPYVPLDQRLQVDPLGDGFFSIVVHYGFMDRPHIPEALKVLETHGLDLPEISTTYYLSRETLIATPLPGMAMWRESLFAFMSRNAQRAATYFQIPSSQVIEIGVQVEL